MMNIPQIENNIFEAPPKKMDGSVLHETGPSITGSDIPDEMERMGMLFYKAFRGIS